MCIGAGAGGVLLGSALQGQAEARPDAAEVRALNKLNAPAPNSGPVDRNLGPNRADLGGGR